MWKWLKKLFSKNTVMFTTTNSKTLGELTVTTTETVTLTIDDVKYLHDLRKVISVDPKIGNVNINLPEDWVNPNVPLNNTICDQH